MGERNKIHVHRQQHQFDRHQQDNHVLPVQENTDNADGEQNRPENKVMG